MREGLVSAGFWWEGQVSAGFWWEGQVSAGFGSFQVVSAGFGSFRFLVITVCFFQKCSPCPADRFQKAELHKDSKNSEGSGTKSLALKSFEN